MKKIIALLLVTVTLISCLSALSSCGINESENDTEKSSEHMTDAQTEDTGKDTETEKQTEKETEKTTEKETEKITEKETDKTDSVSAVDGRGMGQFEITYYWGPQQAYACKEDYIRLIAECGFTSIPLENSSLSQNKKALSYMQKYGLTCSALWDTRIVDALRNSRDLTQKYVDKLVTKVVSDYKDFDNIKGWWLYDEPNASKFDLLAKFVDAFRRLDPTRSTFIDLYPTYAKDEQLGTEGYEAYVETFLDKVAPSYLSYDHYHFKTSGQRKGCFTNLEYIRKYSLESGLDAMQIIQLSNSPTYDNLTYSQLIWEVNMALAYGMKRMSYYVFMIDRDLASKDNGNACMNYRGEIYDHYYDVQKINKWLLPLGNELFGKKSEAVFHAEAEDTELEKNCVRYESYGKLGKIDGNGFVIGFFDDGCFMMVNKKYKEGDEGKNSAALLEASGSLQYFDIDASEWKDAEKEGKAVKNSSGNYVIEFAAGEAFLMKLI